MQAVGWLAQVRKAASIGPAWPAAWPEKAAKRINGWGEPESTLSPLGFREEFVFFDDRSHRHLAFGSGILNPQNLAAAADTNALGQGNFRRQRQGEIYTGPYVHGGINEKADAASAHIPRLGRLRRGLIAGNGNG